MSWHRYLVDPQHQWVGSAGEFGPLALIDLDAAGACLAEPVLPPCPVIGFGRSGHPLAIHLDAVVEAPVEIAMLVARITAFPSTAAVLCDVLRILPGLDDQSGQVAESLAYGLLQRSREHARWLAASTRNSAGAPPGGLEAVREDGLLRLTLDRARSGNTIDRTLRDQLDAAFAMAALDTTITQIRLTARGRAFSLGADLAEFGTTRDPATAHAIRRRSLPARHIARCADRLEVHVAGGCVGAGLEMAAWARRISAGPRAWFQLPELSMGILPGAGGCVALTRRIGRQRTALMVLSGRRISARVALDWGLIDAITGDPPGDNRRAHIVG